ncbi:hypothetical protein CDAR_41641 [Caerostris darwini]|uniref:Uncharacterized protein n=1 Tax=Caerostris darwini TaxID=1538125 RepID=A0AAV4NH68_9ARAC|nr:hypothetical protein CDAR_41641 [Caerostris darwini]
MYFELITICLAFRILRKLFPPLRGAGGGAADEDGGRPVCMEGGHPIYCTRHFLYSEGGLSEFVVLRPLTPQETAERLYRGCLRDLSRKRGFFSLN